MPMPKHTWVSSGPVPLYDYTTIDKIINFSINMWIWTLPWQGIGTKLLKAVLLQAKKRGFKKAQAEAAVANIASFKIAKKCGFKVEGRIKKGLLLDNGKYVDSYLFGKVLK